jgi:hypothetical protein
MYYFLKGGEIYSTFDNPESCKLGHCDVIEEIIIGEDRLIKFSGTLYNYYNTSSLLKVVDVRAFLAKIVKGPGHFVEKKRSK